MNLKGQQSIQKQRNHSVCAYDSHWEDKGIVMPLFIDIVFSIFCEPLLHLQKWLWHKSRMIAGEFIHVTGICYLVFPRKSNVLLTFLLFQFPKCLPHITSFTYCLDGFFIAPELAR